MIETHCRTLEEAPPADTVVVQPVKDDLLHDILEKLGLSTSKRVPFSRGGLVTGSRATCCSFVCIVQFFATTFIALNVVTHVNCIDTLYDDFWMQQQQQQKNYNMLFQ